MGGRPLCLIEPLSAWLIAPFPLIRRFYAVFPSRLWLVSQALMRLCDRSSIHHRASPDAAELG